MLGLDLDTDTEGSHVSAGYPGTMVAMSRILMLVTAALILAGCGEGEPMTNRDVDTIRDWAQTYKPVAKDMLATSEALTKNQLEPATVALGRVKPGLDAAERRARTLETPPVRETLTDYMRITRRTVTAFDAFVAHLRTNPKDRRERIRVLDELRQANHELFKADSKIRERVFNHATEAQEKRLEEAIPKPAYA